ncbi:MAG TPA: hypothetical protein VK846_09590 [Candidatus Limnocylindria bacterium]|nr:hypothetical protein [Candidatus Limnocylindria bacterium]
MKCRNSQRGVALVLTLIMLAIITIVVVVFLATTRRNRQSVTVRQAQTDAEHAAEVAFQHVNARIAERILRATNLLALDFMVSYPVSSERFTNNGVIFHLRAYSNELNANGMLWPTNDNQIPRVLNSSNTVGVYLDLNRNRQFDDPADPEEVPYGDPIWVGVLDKPWLRHGPNNRFIARYAYMVLPVGKALDLNTIHHDTSPNAGYGFMRNQGVGPWELNLAALLHELDPSLWDYDYSIVNGMPEARGTAFEDALSVVRYREGWPLNANTVFNAKSFAQTYIDALPNNFPNPAVDIYSDGSNGIPAGRMVSLRIDDDLPNKSSRWPGSETTNHFFHIQELFDHADLGGFGSVKSNKVTFEFYSNLTNALKRVNANGETNSALYYKLLSLLSTDTGSDANEKINLNFADRHARIPGFTYDPTNFVSWDSSPALAVAFYTNVAERIFLAQSNELNLGTNLIIRSMLQIPVYPTNRYTTAIHRILQEAANIFDAANTNLYPSVFRPLFGPGPIAGANYIVGYEYDPEVSTLRNWLDRNTNGIPLVVGAKKGYPNFNEFTMMSEFITSRKIELQRPATNAPPNMTNQMYTLGISNYMGVELWNSYRRPFPRDLSITVSNFTTASLTNGQGVPPYEAILTTASTTNIAATKWPGRGNLTDYSKLSFIVPFATNQAFLTNSMYRFLDPNRGRFVPIDTNSFENVAGYPVPYWVLTLSNRMTCLIQERDVITGRDRIIDFVLLNDNFVVDLTAELLASNNPYDPDASAAIRGLGLWDTNRASAGAPTRGFLQQISISQGEPIPGIPESEWIAYFGLRREGDKLPAISNFRRFCQPNAPRLDDYPEPQANSSLAMQTPFNPAVKLTVQSTWQANDPLVHYHAEDLRFGATNNSQYQKPSQASSNIAPATLGWINTVYSPWHGNPDKDTHGGGGNLSIKDAGVATSDDWQFPSNKLATIGLLGRVHRGTPWQTIYLKSEVASNDEWRKQSADWVLADPADPNSLISRTHPSRDWKLLDMFTTAIDERSSSGLMSINQTNMEAWSALFSGVLVLSNSHETATMAKARNYDELFITPWGNQPLTNSGFARIWAGILRYQTNHVDKLGRRIPLESIGDLIQGVPELTIQSPFLNLDLGDQSQAQLKFGLDDFAYEWIPQQIASLLRVGQSRFAIYAYGQALKPERIDPSSGRVENYQVTAEFATRTVIRIEGDPRYRVRTVVESFNILPPD